MYQDFYGLRSKPFSLTPDPAYFYRSGGHANALDLVHHGIRSRSGPIVLTGTSGTGKTTLCRMTLEELDRKTFTALVLNPYLSDTDLLQSILQDFGVMSRAEASSARGSGAGAGDLLRALHDFLRSLQPLGATAVLLVDEAQKLPLRMLQQVRRLALLTERGRPLVQVIMVGQPNLDDRLRVPELRDLRSLVSIRYRLRPLTGSETGAYVGHRMSVAGDRLGATFGSAALRSIHHATGGNPRLINLLCDRALAAGFSLGSRVVDEATVARTAASIGLQPPGVSFLGWFRRAAAL